MIPSLFTSAVERASPSWRPVLLRGLAAMSAADPTYLPALAQDPFLPTEGRLFAAFEQTLASVRYVLVGEGPYPREASATGVCFMDGAVVELWSEQGLSKPVNRATSLRNFMKMLLVSEGLLQPQATGAAAMVAVSEQARASGSALIQTLPELQQNLTLQGFLMLNAALVFRPHVPPVKEAKAWLPFLETILAALSEQAQPLPTLVLWGKIALWVEALPVADRFPKQVAEHPYNLSFILNSHMQALFGAMHLLLKRL